MDIRAYVKSYIPPPERRFPSARIKAVVTTTNFWWHVAGIREYAAHHIPIIALDQNVTFIQKLLTSPHSVAPDALEKARASLR